MAIESSFTPSVKERKSPLKATEKNVDEIRVEANLRPQALEEYIGQERLKKILQVALGGAMQRGDKASMGHLLLHGAPGLGKTTCALLLAKLLGTNSHVFSAPALEKPKDIVGILLGLQEGDVLFIDEIHRLNRVSEELLYPALEDFVIDLHSGAGSSARISRLPIARFIMVGATTKLGQISAPLRDRFTHLYRMEFYTPPELSQIALRTASLLRFDLSEEAALELALRGRGTPRILNRLCRLLRDFAQHHARESIDPAFVRLALDHFEIDAQGLDATDRELLRAIANNFGGGPVGLETLAISLGEDPRTIEDYYEPYLIQSGLLERTPRGRKTTAKAQELFAEKHK